MKKVIILLLVVFAIPVVMWGQSSRLPGNQPCNLSVSIDSIVVNPCFRITGGSCGCSNTLWAVVSGGTAPYTYTWSTGGVAAGNGDTIRGACYEYWTVKVQDSGACLDSSSLNVLIPTVTSDTAATAGINKYSNSSSVTLYPVPAVNQLNVRLGASATNMHIEIYDILGNKLLVQNINDGTVLLPVDVSAFANGNYLLKLVGSGGQKTSKFTVDK
jgi:type IX secretion system substrate protein